MASIHQATGALDTTITADMPLELSVFLDYVFDDDRPMFVYEQSQSAVLRIIFRNLALHELVADPSRESMFLDWVGTLSTMATGDTTQPHCRIENLGTFLSKAWARKRVGGSGGWIAVFCRPDYHEEERSQSRSEPEAARLSKVDENQIAMRPEKQQVEVRKSYKERIRAETQTAKQRESCEERMITRAGTETVDTREPHSALPLLNSQGIPRRGEEHSSKLQEPDTVSTSAGAMPTSHRAHDVLSEGITCDHPLNTLVVDWLSFPHLSCDPWFTFVVGHDWEATAIGPLQTWSPTLRQTYTAVLSSPSPRIMYWGNDLQMLYNEAALFVIGDLHPSPLGNPIAEVWGDAMRAEVTDLYKSGVSRGKPLNIKRREFVINRHGYPESAFFDFICLPVSSPTGTSMGFVSEFTEVTEIVLQENRHDVSRALSDNISQTCTVSDMWKIFANTLGEMSKDVSYVVTYSHNSATEPASDTGSFQVQASFGFNDNAETIGSAVPLDLVAALKRSNHGVVLLQESNQTLPQELAIFIPGSGTVSNAYILPVIGLTDDLIGFVVLGLGPKRSPNSNSRHFAESLHDLLFKSTALIALPLEHRRAQEANTALSHQLRVATNKAEASEQNFARMVGYAPIGMAINTSAGYPVYLNNKYLELLDTSRADYYELAEGGIAWRNVVYEDDREAVNQLWRNAVEHETPVHFEFRAKLNSSSSLSDSTKVRWLEVFTHPRCDQNGKVLFLYSWLVDISSRKLTESLTQGRLEDALEMKRSSENFIDMVSHEMRNPLSSILQLADNVLLSLPPDTGDDGVLTVDTRRSLVDTAQTIILCANHQKNIVDDVLTLSKLDSRLLELAPESVQAPAIVESVLKMVKADLQHADIHSSMIIDSSYKDLAVDFVLLDPGRLSQVLLNLMTNAIKFTKASTKRQINVTVAASRSKPTADDCHVTLIEPHEHGLHNTPRSHPVSTCIGSTGEVVYLFFSVQDTGCGLARDEMDTLFHRFTQASPKTYAQYGGSGLGLFISRELTELQGGQIGVQSELSKGSTFAFYVKGPRVRRNSSSEIPEATIDIDFGSSTMGDKEASTVNDHLRPTAARVVSATTAIATTTTISTAIEMKHIVAPQKPSRAQDLHVLIVEDNAINQKVMAQQLRKMGCATVKVADHGLDALKILTTIAFFDSSTINSVEVPLSVILLDVEMPIMDGLTCARRIRQLEKGHVPIIGITANARVDQIAACIEAGMDEVLTKPFRIPDVISRMLALVYKVR